MIRLMDTYKKELVFNFNETMVQLKGKAMKVITLKEFAKENCLYKFTPHEMAEHMMVVMCICEG